MLISYYFVHEKSKNMYICITCQKFQKHNKRQNMKITFACYQTCGYIIIHTQEHVTEHIVI